MLRHRKRPPTEIDAKPASSGFALLVVLALVKEQVGEPVGQAPCNPSTQPVEAPAGTRLDGTHVLVLGGIA